MGTMHLLYCGRCGQTFYTDNEDTCDACGKPGPMMDPASGAALKDLKSQKKAFGPRGDDGEGQIGSEVLGGVKLGCAGAFFIFLGLVLLTVPAFHSDPKGPTLTEALYGVLPILIGSGLIALVVLPLFLGGQQESAEKNEPPPNEQA